MEAFLTDLTTGATSALATVPGVTTQIIDVGVVSLTAAYAHAFKITWLATIGFGALSVIAAVFSRDIDDKLSHDVIRRLGHGFVSGKEPSSTSLPEENLPEDAEKPEKFA